MMSRTAQAYDTLVLHNPILVLIALFSILLFFGYHTKDFKLDASADSLLLEDDADLKVFLTASTAERARRRIIDLKNQGFSIPNINELTNEIEVTSTLHMILSGEYKHYFIIFYTLDAHTQC